MLFKSPKTERDLVFRNIKGISENRRVQNGKFSKGFELPTCKSNLWKRRKQTIFPFMALQQFGFYPSTTDDA
jgi:hypothetical protein